MNRKPTAEFEKKKKKENKVVASWLYCGKRAFEEKSGMPRSYPQPPQVLHHLVLSQTVMGVCFHVLGSALAHVLDEAEVQGTAAILVSLELSNGRLSCFHRIETDNSRAS
jgi:hypothetical protein